jgi:AbrB family looped-hinge helix DNA binding protein
MARTTALTKLSTNYQVVVPKPVRVALGLKSGDLFEATATRHGVLLRPKVLTDRALFLKQLRKDIEASEAAVKAGRVLGPFDNARDAARALREFAKKRRARARRAT